MSPAASGPCLSSSAAKRASRAAAGDARMAQLQEAIAQELGAQHTLKQSQLTAPLGRDLTRRPDADLRGRVRRLREAVGLEAAAALLRSYPPLVLLASAADVRKRLDALAAAFGTPKRDGVLPLCSRAAGAARVLTMLAHTTGLRVEALCGVLRLEREGALALCGAHPMLLMLDSGTMHARADAIATHLGLEPERAAKLCQENPSCLEVPSSTMLAVVDAVSQGLGVAGEAALQLCGGSPFVFLVPAASAAEKAATLKQHLGLSAAMRGEVLAECMVLFSVPAGEVGPRLEALLAGLGISREGAEALVHDQPRFLLVDPATLAAAWKELQQAASMRAEWREQIGGWSASTLSRCLRPGGLITRRVGAVLALAPTCECLPTLAGMLALSEPQFGKMLEKVAAGEVKGGRRAAEEPGRSIRVQHPGLWLQL